MNEHFKDPHYYLRTVCGAKIGWSIVDPHAKELILTEILDSIGEVKLL